MRTDPHVTTRALLSAIVASVLSAVLATPAAAEGLRVRGELTALDSGMATVLTSAGQRIDVKLAEPYVVLLYEDIAFDQLPENAYLSIPAIDAGGGKLRALGVNVFPEAMRGFNEGFGDWDLTGDSSMTNATLAKLVSSDGERALTVQFGEQSQQVLVPPGTPITTFGAAQGRTVDVGEKVVIFAKVAGGTLSGKFVGVHESGELPPI